MKEREREKKIKREPGRSEIVKKRGRRIENEGAKERKGHREREC